MIGGISLTDYAFRLDAINIRYDFLAKDETELKERYKRSKGYKIAHNWSQVRPRYLAMNERNRKQAIYRLVREYDLSFLQDLAAGNFQLFKSAGTISNGPYWATGGAFYVDWFERTEAAGKTPVLGISFDGAMDKVYRDGLQAERAIWKAIRKCGKIQRNYPEKQSFLPNIEMIYGGSKDNANLVYLALVITT